MQTRSVPFNYCTRWILCSIKLAERKYSVFLACGLLSAVTTGLVSLLPFIGGALGAALSFLFTLSMLKMLRKLMAGENITFDNYLQWTFDGDVFRKNQSYLLVLAGLALFTIPIKYVHIEFMPKPYLIWPGSFLLQLIVTVCAMAAHLETTREGMSRQEALETITAGLWQNIITVIVFWILMAVFAAVSAILCFVPLFLYYLPMTRPCLYLVYASIFENMDVDQKLVEWSAITPQKTGDTVSP